jgi:hypothetical protein
VEDEVPVSKPEVEEGFEVPKDVLEVPSFLRD